jgi:mono/diheme cytochrome c family protein
VRVGICIAVLSLALAACVGPVAPDASGEEIYLQLCSNCHARDLEGGIGPALGPGSETASQPDEFLVVSLVQGRGRMPSFASTLDDQQLDRLIGFIREAQAD